MCSSRCAHALRACDVRPLEGFRIELTFSDGTSGIVDLAGLVAREGTMVRPLADPDYFERVFLEAGAPTWPNGFDLAPWALHDELSRAGALSPSPQTA